MRVCIPIEFLPQGGGFYFLDAFAGYLRDKGWIVKSDVGDRYDILFTNHWMTPAGEILRGIRKNPRVRVVQRIDGAAQDYGRDNEADRRQAAVNRLADLTIFQSKYCRYSTRIKFPVIRQDGPVIHNPVDVKTFNPEGEKLELDGKHRIACVSWSTNKMKGATRTYEVAANNPETHFFLCGNFQDRPDLPNVHVLGVLGREELARVLRSCQMLLTFSQNEACPNHVLEGLASGLPVLYGDSGAMNEVIGDCGYAVTESSFSERFTRVSEEIGELSKRARQRALDLFHPNFIFPSYMQVMEKLPTHPKPLRTLRALISN